MAAELKKNILLSCNEINQQYQIEIQNFNFETLKTREWYSAFLELMFPFLHQKIQHINKIAGQAKAIDCIIQQINELKQFEGRIEIDCKKIVTGQPYQIQKLVDVLKMLLQILVKEEQEMEAEQLYQHEISKKINFQDGNHKSKKALSDYDKPKSVQAIVNQFDKSDDQDEIFPLNNAKISKNQTNVGKKPIIQPISSQKKLDNKNLVKKGLDSYQNLNEQLDSNTKQKTTMQNKKKNKVKNPEGHRSNIFLEGQLKKKLITHPKSPQTLKKARSTQAVALTRHIEEDIKKTKKKQRTAKSPSRKIMSPMQQQVKRKTKQYELVANQRLKQKNQAHYLKAVKRDLSEKNEKKIEKLLNYREQQLKKEKRQYEQSIKLKILNQKEQYIKKINKLILQLEKQKQIQEKKDFKQELSKQNQAAVKKLVSLEQWYKNKLSMLKENRKAKDSQRLILKSGHKQIISRIQREMKRQNEQKLIQLTNMYRSQQDNIQTDYEQLRDKIIKVYQKN